MSHGHAAFDGLQGAEPPVPLVDPLLVLDVVLPESAPASPPPWPVELVVLAPPDPPVPTFAWRQPYASQIWQVLPSGEQFTFSLPQPPQPALETAMRPNAIAP
jgi:hypothetical protein